MQYWIYLKKKPYAPDYDYSCFQESFLPGIRVPARVEPMLKAAWVDENYPEWCSHCEMDDKSHPIAMDGSKYCTMLFHDAIKPSWSLNEIV
ncbi:hypothetical protein [Desulfospira joergensenii]|uniref:hypothetical protein n=1 Tax=Desulfospira joergensenii TaxID=53329 RepID=UPI0003B6AB1B|nr:hypothetical protein [Desulfospira joergensenii]